MKFDLELFGKNEFYPNCTNYKSNKVYNVLKVDNIEKETYMNNMFMEFINLKGILYMGIDFEFNKVTKGLRDVALMQINLESYTNIGMIFVLNPTELKNCKILIKLLTTRHIIKILHGAESLDIPYLFNQLLVTKENIDNFCYNFYDTKFLCDYYNLNNNITQKCSIYYLLLHHNIITKKRFDSLESIETKTGPIYLIHINIHKLSLDVLKYSLYDVLFLPELIKKFLKLDTSYTKVIPQISCLVNKYKRNIEEEFNVLSNIINSFNIYYLIDNKQQILLKDIWETYYYMVNDINKYYEKIKEIHYFKFFFEIITKFIIYINIITYFKVYSKNNNILVIKNNCIYSNNIIILENISSYYSWLELYPDLNSIFININSIIKTDFNSILFK